MLSSSGDTVHFGYAEFLSGTLDNRQGGLKVRRCLVLGQGRFVTPLFDHVKRAWLLGIAMEVILDAGIFCTALWLQTT